MQNLKVSTKLVLNILIIILIFVVQNVLVHVNRHQISKLQIPGRDEYAKMTFIAAYYPWVYLMMLIILNYTHPLDGIFGLVMICTGIVLLGYYAWFTVGFVRINLKSGVSKEQDKQRNLCIVSFVMTLIIYVVVIPLYMKSRGYLFDYAD